jgi:integrase
MATATGVFKQCPCSREKQFKCAHSWRLAFKWNGFYHRVSIDRFAGRHIAAKTEAATVADALRDEIKAGRWNENGPVVSAAPEPEQPAAPLPLRALSTAYVEDHLRVQQLRTVDEEARVLARAMDTSITLADGTVTLFGDLAAGSLTVGHISAFKRARLQREQRKHCHCGRAAWATCGHAWHVPAAGGRTSLNRSLARLRALCNWGVRHEHIDRTPFKRDGVAMVDFLDEEGRYRRLTEDEESRLLSSAGSHLAACIIASLEAALRRGEILSLRWEHVSDDLSELRIVASNAKSKRLRVVPVSARLREVLRMRRFDPAGSEFPASAYVFGDAVGEPVKSVNKAWRLTLKRAGLRDLRFHDLRRTGASRLLESGHFALHDVRDVLGHKDVGTTNKYLAGQKEGLKRAMTHRDAAIADAKQASVTVYVLVAPPLAMPVRAQASAALAGFTSAHSGHEGYRLSLVSPVPDGDVVPARLVCCCGSACDVTATRVDALAVVSETATRTVVPSLGGEAADRPSETVN